MELGNLIARFEQVESPRGHPFWPMEAIVEDKRIVFRMGKGCAFSTLGLLILFSAVFLPMVIASLLKAHQFFPFNYVLGIVVFLCVGVLIVDLIRRQSRRVYFVIDAGAQSIMICSCGQGGESYSIGDIKAFLGFQTINADVAWNSLNMILEDGQVIQAVGDLGSTANLEWHLKVIGYTCGILTLYASELPDLDQLMLRTFPNKVADMEKVLAASRVIYDPASICEPDSIKSSTE